MESKSQGPDPEWEIAPLWVPLIPFLLFVGLTIIGFLTGNWMRLFLIPSAVFLVPVIVLLTSKDTDLDMIAR